MEPDHFSRKTEAFLTRAVRHLSQMKAAMEALFKQGRLIFAFCIAAFGVENLVCAHTSDAMMPVIPWVVGAPAAYLTGIALIAASACIAVRYKARLAAALLGILFLLFDVLLQIARVVAKPLDVGVRTCAVETLTMCAAALILAGTLPLDPQVPPWWDRAVDWLATAARYIFAFSMLVFGIDHYLVFAFIVSLVPHWIPGGGWFWAQVTSIAFLAAAISIASGWMARLAAAMLGLMFVLWFLTLHLPRVMSYPRSHNPDEWSSAFIALAVCGGSWILAASLSPGKPKRLTPGQA
jgi:uncharacterized membrane protein YphA (DoxX/SURF4 family)